MSHTDSQLEFFTGKTAMIPCGSWLKSEMKGKIPPGFKLGCFQLPSVDNPAGSPDALFATSNYYFVMSKSKHPREGRGVPALHDELPHGQRIRAARPTSRRRSRGASQGNLSSDMDELLEIIDKSKESFGRALGRCIPTASRC
jgi:hypothetical protein